MRKKGWGFSVVLAIVSTLVLSACAVRSSSVRPELMEGPGWTPINNNLHQVDGPPPGEGTDRAFRLYRSGAPSKKTFAKWCGEFNIERVIVLSGTAHGNEFRFQAEGICPDIQVIYNIKQTVSDPVSDGFLELFDEMIESAQEDRVGILLRCESGSHRAGRTAAYYQMKYQGLTVEEAIAVMDYNGMLMPLYDPVLRPQVRALDDYIHGRPCSEKGSACVALDSERYVP
jgi:hypothetical protein